MAITKGSLPFYDGRLTVYSCLVPIELTQYPNKPFGWQKKREEKRQIKSLQKLIEEAMSAVQKELAGVRIDYLYLASEVERKLASHTNFWQKCDREALTDRLYEILLYQERKQSKEPVINLSLPMEGGERDTDRLITIVEPYLSKINLVVLVGEENNETQRLEDYLYDEYGIVTTYEKYPKRNTLWIDMEDAQKQILLNYAKENGICHINSAEVLKFLDTAAKNGYNTKVN